MESELLVKFSSHSKSKISIFFTNTIQVVPLVLKGCNCHHDMFCVFQRLNWRKKVYIHHCKSYSQCIFSDTVLFIWNLRGEYSPRIHTNLIRRIRDEWYSPITQMIGRTFAMDSPRIHWSVFASDRIGRRIRGREFVVGKSANSRWGSRRICGEEFGEFAVGNLHFPQFA